MNKIHKTLKMGNNVQWPNLFYTNKFYFILKGTVNRYTITQIFRLEMNVEIIQFKVNKSEKTIIVSNNYVVSSIIM